MTLIEYIQNVEKSRARVVIFRIFAVLCVCTLFDALVYDALTDRTSTNGFLTILTGYLAWMVHKDNFRQVYMIAVICFGSMLYVCCYCFCWQTSMEPIG